MPAQVIDIIICTQFYVYRRARANTLRRRQNALTLALLGAPYELPIVRFLGGDRLSVVRVGRGHYAERTNVLHEKRVTNVWFRTTKKRPTKPSRPFEYFLAESSPRQAGLFGCRRWCRHQNLSRYRDSKHLKALQVENTNKLQQSLRRMWPRNRIH